MEDQEIRDSKEVIGIVVFDGKMWNRLLNSQWTVEDVDCLHPREMPDSIEANTFNILALTSEEESKPEFYPGQYTCIYGW